MLKKRYRLPIQFVVNKKAKILKNSYFLIKIFSNNLNIYRFGVVVSKKVSSKAVERNKFKRLIFSEIEKQIKLSQSGERKIRHRTGRDFLIIISPNIKKIDSLEFKKQLNELLVKLICFKLF